VDCGKSTLAGALLHKLGVYDDDTVAASEKEATEKGADPMKKYAWLMDQLNAEREQGVSIDTNFAEFEAEPFHYTLIDAPGHRDFIKNAITGVAHADLAIIVVSALKDEFEAGFSKYGQTREHAVIAHALGGLVSTSVSIDIILCVFEPLSACRRHQTASSGSEQNGSDY